MSASASASPSGSAGGAAHSRPTQSAPQDPELVRLLHEITGGSGAFRHREHIHLAYLAVHRYGMPGAKTKVCGWIKTIAAYEHAPRKYHQTVSEAWIELVGHHVGERPDLDVFEDFAAEFPPLLDKRLLARHYRSTTLAGERARAAWVPPDLEPFPWCVGAPSPSLPS